MSQQPIKWETTTVSITTLNDKYLCLPTDFFPISLVWCRLFLQNGHPNAILSARACVCECSGAKSLDGRNCMERTHCIRKETKIEWKILTNPVCEVKTYSLWTLWITDYLIGLRCEERKLIDFFRIGHSVSCLGLTLLCLNDLLAFSTHKHSHEYAIRTSVFGLRACMCVFLPN